MENTQSKWSRITENRVTIAVVAGSVLLLGSLVVLYLLGKDNWIVIIRPIEITSFPLYLTVGLMCLAIVVWSWQRLLSFFEFSIL